MDELSKVVALVVGLIAVAKGVLDLLKEYRANRPALSELLSSRRSRIAAVLVASGLVFVVGAVWWSSARAPFAVTVQLWDVDQDQKHAVLSSQRFVGSARAGVPDATLRQVGQWVTDQIAERYDLTRPGVRVRLHVPADLSRERLRIETTSAGPIRAHVSVVAGGGKSRIPLDDDVLATLGQDFDLEIERPGYQAKMVRVPWRQTLDREFTLEPSAVSVGIEEFAGDQNAIATWLTNYLAANPRLSIKDPGTLKALQEKLASEREMVAKNPVAQTAIRSSLGIDFLIAGRYDKS